jgi:hypothetical protein
VGKREFETIFLDSARQELLMICKDCGGMKNMTGVYAFDYKQMIPDHRPISMLPGSKKIGR